MRNVALAEIKVMKVQPNDSPSTLKKKNVELNCQKHHN